MEGLVNLYEIKQKLTNFDEALQLILSFKKNIKIKSEKINLTKSIDRILAKNLISLCDNPPMDVSSMDGYAINEKDHILGNTLDVIDESSAGLPSKKKISAGKSVRIFTGACIPEGADKVIIQENVSLLQKNKIQIIDDSDLTNSFIRKKGVDFKKGQYIGLNKKISPRELLLIASMGYEKFEVLKKIKISIISVGNELIKPGIKKNKNKVYASNAYGIAGLLNKYSCECKIMPISYDAVPSIKKNLIKSLRYADLIITVGGASVGNYDLVKTAIQKIGAKFIFEKVNIKPGKPTFAGILKKTPIIGLPGNPVSSYVCAQLFIIPLIKELLSLQNETYKFLTAFLSSNIPRNGSRMHFMRGNVSLNKGKNIVMPKKNQDSSLVKTLQESNCLIIRPPHDKAKLKGNEIEVIKLI
ncbi:MAG: molybdopterin molybdotransferase MoeA [Paracoccaceae bacterium]